VPLEHYEHDTFTGANEDVGTPLVRFSVANGVVAAVQFVGVDFSRKRE
jgi:hypothetical protein